MTAGPDLDGLERLVALRDAGALTPEEFNSEKLRLLNGDFETSEASQPLAAHVDHLQEQSGFWSNFWLYAVGAVVAVLIYNHFSRPAASEGYNRSKYVPCPTSNGSTSTSLCHRH